MDCQEDVRSLDILRSRVLGDNAVSIQTKNMLLDYYGALLRLEKQFPISSNPGEVNILFQWHDAFEYADLTELHSINLEQAAILFNVGALTSQLGYEMAKGGSESLVDAAKLFQEAAGVFVHLKDTIMPNIGGKCSTDLSPKCLELVSNVMLVQAQECKLEKATLAKFHHVALAGYAKYASDVCADIACLLASQELKDHFEKGWKYLFKVKELYYEGLAYLHQSEAIQKVITDPVQLVKAEVAYLRQAYDCLRKAEREASNTKEGVKKAVKELYTKTLGKLEDREEYLFDICGLRSVPDLTELHPIKVRSLVEVMTPQYLNSCSTSIMFLGIIPESATTRWSQYTDMVDKLIREQTDILAAATDEARLTTREMDLPESLRALKPGHVDSVPEKVKTEIERIQKAGGYKHLLEMFEQLSATKVIVSQSLNDCEKNIRFLEDKACTSKEKIGSFHTSKTRYFTNFFEAQQADLCTKNLLEQNKVDLLELRLETIAALMPQLDSPILTIDDVEPGEAVSVLHSCLETLNRLSKNRASLEEGLRKAKRNDDVRELLLQMPESSAADMEYFKPRLTEIYGAWIDAISENTAKQKHVLVAMRESHKIFKRSFDFDTWEKKRNEVGDRVWEKIEVYRSLEHSLQQGLSFYLDLQDAISDLIRDVRSECTGGASSMYSDNGATSQFGRLALDQEQEYSGSNPMFRR